MHKIPFPLSLLQQTQLHNEIYVFLKIRAIKRVWYNFTYKDLSKATGISHTTLRARIKALIQMKWASVSSNGTLALTGVNKLKNSYTKSGLQKTSVCIPVTIKSTKREQILILRSILVNHNLIQQEKAIHRKETIVNNTQAERSLSSKQRRILKNAGSVQKLSDSMQVINLSNAGFGSLIDRSMVTGQRLQRALNKANLIKSKTRLRQVATGISRLEWLYNYLPTSRGLIYNAKTKTVYQRQPNAVTFLFA